MSYGERDDTLPRPHAIVNHFKQNMVAKYLGEVRTAFSNAWGTQVQIKCPTEFKVEIWFDRILPKTVVDAIESELTAHDWKNFQFAVAPRTSDMEDVHHLYVQLDPGVANEFASRLS